MITGRKVGICISPNVHGKPRIWTRQMWLCESGHSPPVGLFLSPAKCYHFRNRSQVGREEHGPVSAAPLTCRGALQQPTHGQARGSSERRPLSGPFLWESRCISLQQRLRAACDGAQCQKWTSCFWESHLQGGPTRGRWSPESAAWEDSWRQGIH